MIKTHINNAEIAVIQFSIDKNRIEFPVLSLSLFLFPERAIHPASQSASHRTNVELSFHDHFAFLFMLTALKYIIKYIGYDHFATFMRSRYMYYVVPIKQSNVRRITLRWQILYWISFVVLFFPSLSFRFLLLFLGCVRFSILRRFCSFPQFAITYGHIYLVTSHLYVTYLHLPSHSIYCHCVWQNSKTNYVYMQSLIYASWRKKKKHTERWKREREREVKRSAHRQR